MYAYYKLGKLQLEIVNDTLVMALCLQTANLNVICCTSFLLPNLQEKLVPLHTLTMNISLQPIPQTNYCGFNFNTFTYSVVSDQLNRLFLFAVWKSRNLSLIF